MSTHIPKRSSIYLVLAWAIAGVGVVALLGAGVLYWWTLSVGDGQEISRASADWGTFGDFVGGIAGTAIALCTLVALAFTLHLQAKELEATRQELGKQTAAARRQLVYEARRVRPFVTTEWVKQEAHQLQWDVKNVGLGPCIIDYIELQKANGDPLGIVSASADPNVLAVWQLAFSDSWSDESYSYKPRLIQLSRFHNFNRVLGANDMRMSVVTLTFQGSTERDRAFDRLESDDWIRALVHYRAIDGQSFSTLTQLETFDETEGPVGAVVSPREFPMLADSSRRV